MNNLMNESAAARRDVHHQRFMPAGIVAIWRSWLFAEQQHRVLFVRGRVLEQPDIENLFRVLREVVLLEFIDGPFDGALGMLFHGGGRVVANHHEWWLHGEREN